jgi:hypothetical protein
MYTADGKIVDVRVGKAAHYRKTLQHRDVEGIYFLGQHSPIGNPLTNLVRKIRTLK